MDSKTLRKYIFLFIVAAILLAIVLNINEMVNFFSWIYNAFSALTIGACMAFILNMLVDFFEAKVFTKTRIQREKLRITLSMVAALIILLLLVVILILIVVPQLIQTFETMGRKVPYILDDLQNFSVSLSQRFPDISEKLSGIKASETHFAKSLIDLLKKELPETFDHTFILASKTVKSVITFFIGFLISIYIILSKERLRVQAREITYGLLSKQKAIKAFYIAHLASKDFKAFILGRVVDAILMAVAYFIIALILRLPYTLMISSIIAVFSIIPLFGALISWGIGFILIVTVSFWKAVLFSVVILAILFITRNFIYPKLIGDSIGLPDLWVLVAVVVGGKLFGLLGMITAVPIFSVLYHLLAIFIQTRLKGKHISYETIKEHPNWNDYDKLTNTFNLTQPKNKDMKKGSDK